MLAAAERQDQEFLSWVAPDHIISYHTRSANVGQVSEWFQRFHSEAKGGVPETLTKSGTLL